MVNSAAAAGVTAGTDENTVFLINTSLAPAEIKKKLGVAGAKVYTVDATQIALDSFGKPIPNMPMTGALLQAQPFMELDELTDAMKTKFSNVCVKDGFAYGLDEGRLACLEVATGKRRWKGTNYGYGQNLRVGDHILVSKFIYGIKVPLVDNKLLAGCPARGDIIVFVYPRDRSKDFIKRVIGLPGEKIQIVGKEILVNDVPIEDPWGKYETNHVNTGSVRDKYGPQTVPPDSLFVMGDNRDNSQDSRYWGFVDLNAVKGKAFVIYFSWDRTSRNLLKKIRWGRIGHLIR